MQWAALQCFALLCKPCNSGLAFFALGLTIYRQYRPMQGLTALAWPWLIWSSSGLHCSGILTKNKIMKYHVF